MTRLNVVNPSSLPEMPDAAWRREFRRRLLAWYRRHARALPWRRTRDPYHVWLSEIMLQQTQVRTVEAYFERFITALPTIHALARAEERRVLRLWEGLGYYRRARQLHRAAREIVGHHGGEFPRDPAVVRRLPGVGRYTAGAILSIAFDQREPIVEANTMRLYARLLAYDGDPARTPGQQVMWQLAEALLPRRDTGQLNQALMELGSLVCLVREPRCDECPVRTLCAARAAGSQHTIPRVRSKPAAEQVREAAVIVRRNGRLLMLRYDGKSRWSGLWDFPRFRITAKGKAALRREMADSVQRLFGVRIADANPLATLRHSVTRYRITLECFTADFAGTASQKSSATRWVPLAELEELPLSTTGRKLCRLVVNERATR